MNKILYAEGNTDTIVEAMYKSLGKPSIDEITKETIRDKWMLAFARFNEKVGKLGYHTCTTVANQQVYDITTLIPTEDVRDVLRVIRSCSNIKTTNISAFYGIEEVVLTTKDSTDVNMIDAIPAGRLLDTYTHKFIEPYKLILYPVPTDATTIIIITKEAYTTTTLPDKYETIITEYAEGLCQTVVGNARARLNAPLRNDNGIIAQRREKSNYDENKRLTDLFDIACEEICMIRLANGY